MPGLNTKSYYTGVVDNNDLAYVIERFGNPKKIIPAPISRFKIGEHKGKPKINPHVSSFLMKDGRTVSVFHVKPIYYLHVNGQWRPLSEVTTYHGNRKLIFNNKWEQIEPWYLRWLMKRCEFIGGQVLIPWRFDNVPVREGQEIYFATLTVYPDPNVEVTSVDGTSVFTGTTWALARDSLTGTSDDSSGLGTFVRARKVSTSDWRITRGFFLFDTSALGAGATISAATFSLAATAAGVNNGDTATMHIVASTPASNTAIADGDYDQLGATSFGSIAYSAWVDTNNTYNDVTVNATGQSDISKTSITKFGTRDSLDLNNTEPTLNNSLDCYMADNAGTTSDPKLVVTYTAGATGALQGFNMTGFWGA